MAGNGTRAVRFALVGCGTIVRHHLGALQQSSHVTTVTAVVDIDRGRAEEVARLLPRTQQEKCKVFTSLSDALQWGEFDAVVVMLPHHLHEPCATECLQAGKHLLLEKPLAHTVESCQKLLKQAQGIKQQVFMVGENSVFWPEVQKAKELIENGTIGEPYFAQANYCESIGSMDFCEVPRDEDNWFYDPAKAGGGVLMKGATHWVRPLRLWFGDIVEVIGTLGYPFKLSQRSESLAHAMLRFGSGKTAVLHCHFTDIPMYPLPFFQIFGDKGEITIDGSFDGGISVRTRDNPKGHHFGSLGGYSSSFGPQMEAFLDAVVNGGKQEVEDSPCQALQEVLVAQAVYKSVQSRQWESTALDNLQIEPAGWQPHACAHVDKTT